MPGGGADISASISGTATSGASQSSAFQGGSSSGNSKYNYGLSASAIPTQTWLVIGGVTVAGLALVGFVLYLIFGREK